MSASTARQILEMLGPSCHDSGRRARLLAQQAPNGIDFIEFVEIAAPPARHMLYVHFLTDLPPGAYGLPLDPRTIQIHGGTRVTGITVISALRSVTDAKVLSVEVDRQGDFSSYLLTIGWSRGEAILRRDEAGEWRWDEGAWHYDFNEIDRPFSVGPINFRPGCPSDFDCAPSETCPAGTPVEPMLDYLARDYASFRQMLLDLVAQRHPAWTERSAADVGVALLELFAHEGDHLSYFQDAIANEAYLDTARQRVSAKRHAKLVDYPMHDGRNAWTFAHVRAASAGTMAPGQQLVTRITAPMRFDRQPGVTPIPRPTAPPGTVLNVVKDEDYRTDPALAQAAVFETAATVRLDPLHNELYIHTWGNEECCLPRGARTAHLYAIDRSGAAAVAVRPSLQAGDYLLFEEVRGTANGAPADADRAHRQVVRILRVSSDDLRDGLFLAGIDPTTDEPKSVPPAPAPPPAIGATLPLLEVTWRTLDAPKFPLCVSVKLEDDTVVRRVSVARGNMVAADHGRSVIEDVNLGEPLEDRVPFRLRVSHGPLTMQCEPDDPNPPPLTSLPPVVERHDLRCDVRAAKPAIALEAKGPNGSTWRPVPDLLSSTEFKKHFVADVDDEGRAVLRFGDGEYGQRFTAVESAKVWYRVGNGSAGNIAADALTHIVRPNPVPAGWPAIEGIRNPLAAVDGTDPELIEQVRQYAPAAFRATQYRAVTEQDYKNAALTIDGVSGAVASFRWTGSWYTVFVGIDPADPDNVLTNERGVTRLHPVFAQHVLDALTRYRLAGYDLEIRPARYVPLDVGIELCVKPGYFRGDVARAVSIALGDGLFNPAHLSFGQPVYLSRVYAAIVPVAGVESATITVFHPHGRDPGNELTNGVIPIGGWEVARLDNDPSNRENGTLAITAGGGS